MRRAFVLFLVVTSNWAFGQGQYGCPDLLGSGVTGVDKLGAHQNGNKGCLGCHAPHNGTFGNGGNSATGQVQDNINAGNWALWGQDLGPLYAYPLTQGDKAAGGATFTTTLPQQADFASFPQEINGIMMCLSCHDGNIASGSMMTNRSYEQTAGLLPKGLYGPNAIPTLLGNDGTTAGNYYNDHPIGSQATLGAVGVASKLQYLANGCGSSKKFDCLKDAGTDANFTAFVNHYGLPSITSNGHGSPVALPEADPARAYLLCITCHTPHNMSIATANADAPIHTLTKGCFASYWFVAAPYNMGSEPGPTRASSATQMCRQCHYSGAGGANEGSGILNVDTAF